MGKKWTFLLFPSTPIQLLTLRLAVAHDIVAPIVVWENEGFNKAVENIMDKNINFLTTIFFLFVTILFLCNLLD